MIRTNKNMALEEDWVTGTARMREMVEEKGMGRERECLRNQVGDNNSVFVTLYTGQCAACINRGKVNKINLIN